MDQDRPQRTPGRKLLLAILVGFLLSIPLFTVWRRDVRHPAYRLGGLARGCGPGVTR